MTTSSTIRRLQLHPRLRLALIHYHHQYATVSDRHVWQFHLIYNRRGQRD